MYEPTLGGFQEFIENIMGVPNPPYDPMNPPVYVTWAFETALNIVNRYLQLVPNRTPGAWTIYMLAVYNLAADNLINIAQDPKPYVIFEDGLPYWQYLRKSMSVLSFVAGVVQSSSDQGTSASYQIPRGFEDFTIANLQNLKTPFGRAYLGYAQSWGTLWGLS